MSRDTRAVADVTTDVSTPHGGSPVGNGRRGPLERVTVNLTPRSSRALDEVVGLTQDSKTDAINRALQVYAYLERIMQEGGAVYTQGAGGSDFERLRFI